MNWGGLSVVVGLIGLSVATAPFGLVVLVGLAWMLKKG